MIDSLSIAGTAPGISTRVLTAVLLFGFGAFLIWGTGLAGAEILHNAAHDTRHALGFPCH